jgi:hypothetical protein
MTDQYSTPTLMMAAKRLALRVGVRLTPPKRGNPGIVWWMRNGTRMMVPSTDPVELARVTLRRAGMPCTREDAERELAGIIARWGRG